MVNLGASRLKTCPLYVDDVDVLLASLNKDLDDLLERMNVWMMNEKGWRWKWIKCESIVSQKTAVLTVRRWAATSEFPIYSLGDGQVGCQCLSCAVALKIHLSVCSFHSLTDLIGWVSFLPPEIQQNAIVFVVKAETVGCGNFSACTDINSSSDFIMVLVRSNLNGVYTIWLIVFIIGWMQSSKDFH